MDAEQLDALAAWLVEEGYAPAIVAAIERGTE